MMLGIGADTATTNAITTVVPISAVGGPPPKEPTFMDGAGLWLKYPMDLLKVAPTVLGQAIKEPNAAVKAATTPFGLGVLAVPALAVYLLLSMGNHKK